MKCFKWSEKGVFLLLEEFNFLTFSLKDNEVRLQNFQSPENRTCRLHLTWLWNYFQCFLSVAALQLYSWIIFSSTTTCLHLLVQETRPDNTNDLIPNQNITYKFISLLQQFSAGWWRYFIGQTSQCRKECWASRTSTAILALSGCCRISQKSL